MMVVVVMVVMVVIVMMMVIVVMTVVVMMAMMVMVTVESLVGSLSFYQLQIQLNYTYNYFTMLSIDFSSS